MMFVGMNGTVHFNGKFVGYTTATYTVATESTTVKPVVTTYVYVCVRDTVIELDDEVPEKKQECYETPLWQQSRKGWMPRSDLVVNRRVNYRGPQRPFRISMGGSNREDRLKV